MPKIKAVLKGMQASWLSKKKRTGPAIMMHCVSKRLKNIDGQSPFPFCMLKDRQPQDKRDIYSIPP